jgi:predicted transcriptional regulator
MRSDVYNAMLGLGEGDEAETLASVRRGLADMDAGRVRDLDEVFKDLDSDDEP